MRRAALPILLLLSLAPPPAGAAPKHGTPPGQERKADREARPADGDGRGAAAEPAPEPSGAPAPEPAAGTSSRGNGNGRAKGRGARREVAPPAPAPTASPAVTPAPATPAPATPAPAPPAAATPFPAPPAVAPAPRDRAPAPTRRTRRARPAADPAPLRKAAAGSPVPAVAVPAGRPAPGPAAAPAAPRAGTDRDRPAARRDKTADVVTRTVTRIVEVTPAALRRALAALLALAGALAVTAAALTVAARRAERQRRAASAEADLLQSALVPPVPDHVGASTVSVAYRPAAGPAAGGDFYDVFDLDGGRTAVIVGDVTGHGPDALPLTPLVRYTVRAYLEAGMTPRQALRLAGEVLDHRLGGVPVTVLAAVHDGHAGRLTYACAGHPPPIVIGDERPAVLAAASPPLGCGVPTGRRQTTIAVPAGTAAVIHTDGLCDAAVAGHRLGPADLLARMQAVGPRATAEEVLAAVTAGARQTDDMAACVVRSDATGVLAVAAVEELEIDERDLARDRAAAFLLACGVAEAAVVEAVERARAQVARDGGAVLEVSGDRWPSVRVRPAAAPLLAAH